MSCEIALILTVATCIVFSVFAYFIGRSDGEHAARVRASEEHLNDIKTRELAYEVFCEIENGRDARRYLREHAQQRDEPK